jgi:hypothetical protein
MLGSFRNMLTILEVVVLLTERLTSLQNGSMKLHYRAAK